MSTRPDRDRDRDPAPERPAPARGPVPVRDLMKAMAPDPEPDTEVASRGDGLGLESGFENEDGAWIVRSTGAGAYGTGRTGAARLVAVHFFREAAPETPVREALVPAGVFPHLGPGELRALFDRATPIDLDR